MLGYIPEMIAVLIILIIGLFADNRIVRRSYHWKVVSKVLDKIGVDEAVDKTAIGDTIKRSGMTTVRVFDALIRWFVYLIFIMAAVNVLNILVLTALMHQVVMHQVVLYIPHLILGIIVLVVGLIVADFVMDRIGEQLAAKKVEFADVITTVLRAIFYLVVDRICIGPVTRRYGNHIHFPRSAGMGNCGRDCNRHGNSIRMGT